LSLRNIWDGLGGEVLVEQARDICENEGNVTGPVRENGGQSGQCIVGANSEARDSAIGED